MRSVLKYSKYSKSLKWLILIIIVILVGMLVLNTKNNLTSLVPSSSNFSTIENLQASMSRFANSGPKFYIKFTYTNPSSFGGGSAGFPIFYLLDFKDSSGNNITDPNTNKQKPSVTELLTQYYLNKDPADSRAYAPVIQRGSTSDQAEDYYTTLSSNYNTASSPNVSGSINEDITISGVTRKYLLDTTKFNTTNIASGSKFWFGIGLQINQPAGWNTDPDRLPNVYGNFKYVVLTAEDPPGPDPVGYIITGDGANQLLQYNY